MHIKNHILFFVLSTFSFSLVYASNQHRDLILTPALIETIHAIHASLNNDQQVLQQRFPDLEIIPIQPIQNSQAEQLVKLAQRGLSFSALTGDPGYYALADQLTQIILQQQPDNESALFLNAKNLRNRHHFSETKSIAQQLVKSRGLWIDYILLGDTELDLGALDAAQNAYQQAMNLKPGYLSYARAGLLSFEQNKLDKSLFFLTLANKAAPKNSPKIKSFINTNIAKTYYYLSKLTQAEKYAQLAYQQWPSPGTSLLFAKILKSQLKTERATEVLTRLKSYYPHPKALTLLIEMGVNKAQNTLLLEHMNSAIDARSYAFYLLEYTHKKRSALALAQAEYEDRQDIRTTSLLTLSLIANNRTKDAVKAFNRVKTMRSPYKEYRQAKKALERSLKKKT